MSQDWSQDRVTWAVNRLVQVGLTNLVLLVIISVFTYNAIHYTYVYLNESAVNYEVEIPPQLKPGYIWPDTSRSLRNTHEEVRDGKIYPRCPADGRPLDEAIIPATRKDIDIAIEKAATAQVKWAKTSFSQRRRVLATLLQYLLKHQDEIVTASCLDSGKTKVDACFGEILVTASKLQWTIKHGEKALAPTSTATDLLMSYKSNHIYYEPLGVVAACVSWNYPFHNIIGPVISAFFAGNAIIIKPSEQTCWSTIYYLRLIRGALTACGHDPNLIQNEICLPDVADHLTSHPGISHITFIGSREIAFKVCASAAKALIPVCVELGGKDPSIVLDDKSTRKRVDEIVAVLMRGVFQSSGQNCIGIERVIALPAIHDMILKRVREKISNMRLGSVLLQPNDLPDMGAMISTRSFHKLESLIQDAVAEGAILHVGGKRYDHPLYPNGNYFQPTLLSNVTPDMQIAQTELFAPVFLLMKARNVDHAIELANSTIYDLGSSVFGTNRDELNKIAKGVRAGMVAVNDFATFYVVCMPFGGRKGSGYGRFQGYDGLRSLCNYKSVCDDAWWAQLLGIRTQIPGPLQYPINKKAWQICCGVVETGYSLTMAGMFRGIGKLLGGLMTATSGQKSPSTSMNGKKED